MLQLSVDQQVAIGINVIFHRIRRTRIDMFIPFNLDLLGHSMLGKSEAKILSQMVVKHVMAGQPTPM